MESGDTCAKVFLTFSTVAFAHIPELKCINIINIDIGLPYTLYTATSHDGWNGHILDEMKTETVETEMNYFCVFFLFLFSSTFFFTL